MIRARVRFCLRVSVCVLLLFVVISAIAWGGSVSLTLSASPGEVSRGGTLTYTSVITNSGPSSMDLTYQHALPTGLDQWNAQYRLNGGGWSTYPPAGLIPLGTLLSGEKVTVDIQVDVEHSAPGTLTSTARVTDGTTQLASMTITTNVLPWVDAGADKMVGLGGTITFSDASAGDGGDGIATYSWDDGGAAGLFDDNGAIQPTYTAPGTSELVKITLTVTDYQGGQANDSFWLRVNAFPTVDAGVDRSMNEGSSIMLSDASASDPDGWIVSHSWSDNGGGGSFDDPSAFRPTYTAPMTDNCMGEYITLTLTVTDNWGAQASDALTLHVRNVNVLPDVVAGTDQTVQEGDLVTLIGSATDPDGTIVSYAWEQISGPVVSLSGANTNRATFIAPVVVSLTTLQFRLTVLDNCGGSASDSISIRVENINVPPVANAGPNQTVRAGDRATLTGSGSDSDGTIDSYAWEQTGGPSVLLSGAHTHRATFIAPAVSSPTSLWFRLTVTDNDGDSASDEAIVTVNPGVPPAEEISIAVEKMADPMSAMVGDTVRYTYTVTNTGEATLFNVTAIDDRLGDITLSRTTLTPGQSTTGTASAVVQESDLPGPLTNTVTVQGMSEAGTWATAGDEASVQLSSARSSIEVILEAQDAHGFTISPLDILSVGETITYVYTITNTGQTTLTDLSLTDDRLGEIALSRSTIAQWQRVTGSFSVTITEADLPGPFVNTVVVTAVDPRGNTVTDSDTLVLFDLASDGALALLKTSDPTEAAVGDTITYMFTIANTGDVILTDLVLFDDHIGEIPLPTRILTPGQSLTVTATYIVTEADLPGPLTNMASITGHGLAGGMTVTETTVSVTLSEIIGGGGAISQQQGRIVISEIAWAGSRTDPAAEWIELANIGTTPVDLTGWRLAWYKKTGTVPPPSQWHSIELSGVIDPLIQHALKPAKLESVPLGDGLWTVHDPRWSMTGQPNGLFIMERAHDGVIANVRADLVYGDAVNPYFDLPDAGASIFLIDPDGRLVDSANAQYVDRTGWPAGNVITGATMERINLSQGDFDGNWQSSPGILTYGVDASGRRLLATAGQPNSLPLERFLQDATVSVRAIPANGTISVPLPSTDRQDRPSIKIATLEPVAGGGGAVGSPELSTIRRGADVSMEIDFEHVPSGDYFVWISFENGNTLLLPLRKGSSSF